MAAFGTTDAIVSEKPKPMAFGASDPIVPKKAPQPIAAEPPRPQQTDEDKGLIEDIREKGLLGGVKEFIWGGPSALQQSADIRKQLHEMYNRSPEKAKGVSYFEFALKNPDAVALGFSDPFVGSVGPGEGARGIKAAFAKRVAPITESYKKTFQPELMSETATKADPLFAKYQAVRAQEKDSVVHEAQQYVDYWRKVDEPTRLSFLRAVETKAPLEGTAKQMGERYRKLFDTAYKEEKEYGSQASYRENYFPHLWEKPEEVKQYFNTLASTPTFGPRWFQKARTWDLIDQGLRAGYKLRSTNPEQLATMRLMASADMKARVGLLRDLEGMGAAFPVKGSGLERPLKGWFNINAPNGQQWFIRNDLGPLWKNAVDAKGLWSNEGLAGSAFRGWMKFKNVWVPIRLSLSMFHPIHVLHINQSAALSRAAEHVWKGGSLTSALRNVGDVVNIWPTAGKEARAAWLKRPAERTPAESEMVKLMQEGGFSPQLSEQLRISARENLAGALERGQYIRAIPAAIRRAVEVIQAPIFEKWIPNLKAAAYMNEARLLFERRPELLDDASSRALELRRIAKSTDNRFGEMFYSTLFWDRTVKDAAIGSFLSLGWNLGFLREFGGGLIADPARLVGKAMTGDAHLMRDISAKTFFATTYTTTAMMLGGMLTYMLSGKPPTELMDYIFPATGGVNPDGTKHRLSTPFYTREIPQLAKHVQDEQSWILGMQDMLWNKLMFQPIAEVARNRSYWGYDITDINAPWYKQAQQYLNWMVSEQLPPLTVAQAKRSMEQTAAKRDFVLSFMGFGPAPSYATRSAMQNRIEYLYRRHVAPASRPQSEKETADYKRQLRGVMLDAVKRGDGEAFSAALDDAARHGIDQRSFRNMGIPGDIILFKALPEADQVALLKQANKDEFKRYAMFAKTRAKIGVLPLFREYMQ